jgi:hypothetical protein
MERFRYILGVLTLAVVAVAGWLVFGLLGDSERDGAFHVRLEFRDVRGLKPGADVRYRGVRVGTVHEVSATDDGAKATVLLRLADDARTLAAVNSRFWIVSPRFRGLTDGASGLDTLVRDSYVAFLTPNPPGPELAVGSLVAGHEKPYLDDSAAGLDPVRHGDLNMQVLAAENHGIGVGADVRFRGIVVGDVRGVELATDGSHVQLTLRVAQRYRHTVTDRSEFWLARPRLSGALIGGIAVEDLNAILAPYVGYHTVAGKGLPVPDGFRTVATDERPAVGAGQISLDAPAVQPDGAQERPAAPTIRVVDVAYEAVESDVLSADDQLERTGTGLMFVDSSGRTVVATCRSLCDGSYFTEDTFGSSPEITKESIRVAILGGAVLRAGRSWVDPQGHDLAVLVVENAPPDAPTTAAVVFEFGGEALGEGTAVELVGAGAASVAAAVPAWPDVESHRGWVVTRGGRVVGLLGQGGGFDSRPVLVPIELLPAELRPAR